MPRVPGRAQRLLLSSVLGLSLVAVPGVASADPPVKHSEHFVFFDCFFVESELNVSASISSEFGGGAFVGSPDFFGETFDAVTVVESGGGATIDATIPLFDPDQKPVGDAVLHAILTPTGQVEVIDPSRERFGNHWVRTTGVLREMAVIGSLMLPALTIDLSGGECFSQIGDIERHETPPETFVTSDAGIFIDCFWATDDTVASLFAISGTFGTFADVHLESLDHLLFTVGEGDVTLTAEALSATVPLFDEMTLMDASAIATATFEPLGDPVTSIIVGQSVRVRQTEQRLIPDGTLNFSTGEQFAFDGEACFAATFDAHVADTPPRGPKPGEATAANDTPDGAAALALGGVVNDQTRNTAVAPELPLTTCPQEDDALGHTLWYTFTGTGGSVVVDTAGSNFDTVVAVYDDALTELACNDDVEFEPIGFTLQAAVTIDTVEGATYYVQAGGFDPIFFIGESRPEFGRLRIAITG